MIQWSSLTDIPVYQLCSLVLYNIMPLLQECVRDVRLLLNNFDLLNSLISEFGKDLRGAACLAVHM